MSDAAEILFPSMKGDSAPPAPTADRHSAAQKPVDPAAVLFPSMKGEATQPPSAGEQKPGDQKPADQKQERAIKLDAPHGEYQIQAPEGMELDAEALKEFAPVAKELGLTNDQAQKLADIHSKTIQRQQDVHEQTVKGWEKESLSTISPYEIDNARAFIKTYADAEVSNLLTWSGLGNHPSVIKLLAEAGAQIRRARR